VDVCWRQEAVFCESAKPEDSQSAMTVVAVVECSPHVWNGEGGAEEVEVGCVSGVWEGEANAVMTETAKTMMWTIWRESCPYDAWEFGHLNQTSVGLPRSCLR